MTKTEDDIGAIDEVVRFRTSDGELHSSRHSAEIHVQWMKRTAEANRLLESGATLLDVATAHNHNRLTVDQSEILSQATKDTGIVIPHWQLGELPSYRVTRIASHGPHVWGIGGWMGGYGSVVSWMDLAQYLASTKEKVGLGPVRSYQRGGSR